mmetsp:Transcript_43762/g.50325  ORF Transcript_43762/g.50325 Transcript_43762/m.50325 type:complete len:297 (-) Transcript_43762:343-1233(-)
MEPRQLFVFSLLIVGLSAKCSFTQICSSSGVCEVPSKLPELTEPGNSGLSAGSPWPCPMYDSKNVCCNTNQISELNSQFQVIDNVFGSGAAGGLGCGICAANLKFFWCAFTCAPNQADFVLPEDQQVLYDPDSLDYMKVLVVTVEVNPTTACELFESCKKTPFAIQVTDMHSSEGFLNFQGVNAMSMGSVYIKMKYPEDSGFNGKMFPCSYDAVRFGNHLHGYDKVTSCSCGNCDALCTYTLPFKKPATFEGANFVLIGVTWGVVLLLGAIAFFATHTYNKRRSAEMMDNSINSSP